MKHFIIYIIASVFVLIVMLFSAENKIKGAVSTNFNLIKTFNAAFLTELPLSDIESNFYSGFPGEVKRYSIRGRTNEELIIKYIAEISRKLHGSTECYKAFGYEITYAPVTEYPFTELNTNPLTWSQFIIKEGNNNYSIFETIVSLSGNYNYREVSEWFWNTAFSSKDKGPWVAVIWKRPLENSSKKP